MIWVQMICDVCGYETEKREQFAGHRSGHVRRGEVKKHDVIDRHVCKDCGEEFDDGLKLAGHHYRLHIGRKTTDMVAPGTIKRFLIEIRGRRCEHCKNDKWNDQPIPITLDHIDGNSDNNVEENLKLLCPNCHAQTPTYGGRNVGRFPYAERSARRAKSRFRRNLSK